jgi:hypothetical protein
MCGSFLLKYASSRHAKIMESCAAPMPYLVDILVLGISLSFV